MNEAEQTVFQIISGIFDLPIDLDPEAQLPEWARSRNFRSLEKLEQLQPSCFDIGFVYDYMYGGVYIFTGKVWKRLCTLTEEECAALESVSTDGK